MEEELDIEEAMEPRSRRPYVALQGKLDQT